MTKTSLLPYSGAELEAAAAAGSLRAYDVLGAHCCLRAGLAGVAFAVWAPNAKRVDVVGDFNAWQPAAHPLQLHRNTGIWQLFVPGLQAGALSPKTPKPHDIHTNIDNRDILSMPYE